MIRIGLLSDTHGYLDPQIEKHFTDCDEIWHAGDIGDPDIARRLNEWRPLRAVYGNIDGASIRNQFTEELVFECEGLHVYMTHIGGYPGNYSPKALQTIGRVSPGLFICGHSHILKVMPDNSRKLLHMNPGASGKEGFHKFRTALRFKIDQGKIQDLEVIELGLRGKIESA